MKITSIAKRILLKKHFLAIVLWLVFLIVSAVCVVIAPLFIKRIIDEGVDFDGVSNLNMWLFGLITVVGIVSHLMVKTQTINLQYLIDKELKIELYSAILRSDTIDLEKLNIGEKYSKIDKLSKHISEDLFTNGIVKAITIFVYSICFFVVFFSLNKVLGFSMLFLTLAYTAIKINIIRDINNSKARHEEMILEDTESLNKVTEKLKEIKIENQVEDEIHNFEMLVSKQMNESKVLAKAHEIEARYIYEVALAISSILSLVFISNYSNDFSSGSIIASIIIMSFFYLNLNQLSKIRLSNRNYEEDINELEALLNVRIENRVVSVNEFGEVNSLVFDNVSFMNASSEFAIENISFDLSKGESLCIYGANEEGRSTLSYLISKILRPRQGKIIINETDIRKIDTQYLRSIVSVISKQSIIKNKSIRENIIQGLEVDDYRYSDALNKSDLKGFLKELPDKDKTLFNEKDAAFTPDIIKKILFARTFYKDPSIFVLDNCTDFSKQQDTNEILDEITRNKRKILILITDNINLVNKCTKVLLLKKGNQLEYGITKELLNNPKSKLNDLLSKKGR